MKKKIHELDYFNPIKNNKVIGLAYNYKSLVKETKNYG